MAETCENHKFAAKSRHQQSKSEHGSEPLWSTSSIALNTIYISDRKKNSMNSKGPQCKTNNYETMVSMHVDY